MKNDAWYHKYSYVVFLLVAAGGLFHFVPMMFNPMESAGVFADFGYPLPEGILASPNGEAFIRFLMRWVGAVGVGSEVLTALIALTGWRKGEKWAWMAFLYWPFVLFYHYSLYLPGPGKTAPLVMFSLVTITLLANLGRFFSVLRVNEPLAAGAQN